MGVEIERKFLVKHDGWRAGVESGSHIVQGYLILTAYTSVRIRIRDERAMLTVKGPTYGIRRAEFEYTIPVADAEAMLRDLASAAPVEKTRYQVRHGVDLWDLDVFAGENTGLVLAEIELSKPDEVIDRPDWLGEEVSKDPRYFNLNLARHPYRHW